MNEDEEEWRVVDVSKEPSAIIAYQGVVVEGNQVSCGYGWGRIVGMDGGVLFLHLEGTATVVEVPAKSCWMDGHDPYVGPMADSPAAEDAWYGWGAWQDEVPWFMHERFMEDMFVCNGGDEFMTQPIHVDSSVEDDGSIGWPRWRHDWIHRRDKCEAMHGR